MVVAREEGLRIGVPAAGQRGAHRGARHRLDATGDDDVVVAGHHAGDGEVQRLLAGAALAVHGDTGDGLGPSGGQHGGARDVERLLAGLHDAAPDDIVDESRIDPGALHQTVEDLGRQVGRVHTRQSAVALADR